METEPGKAIRRKGARRDRRKKETGDGNVPSLSRSHNSSQAPEREFPVPPPLDQFLSPRNPQEDAGATMILQLAEAFATQRLGPGKRLASVSVAQGSPQDPPAPPVRGPLVDCLQSLFALVEADPGLSSMLDALPAMLGDGYPLLLLFRSLFQPSPQPVLRADGKPYLTPQQTRVLDAACCDPLRSRIAASLDISLNTVDTHFRQIYQRLGVHSQEEAVARAYALGYLNTSDLHNLIFRMGEHHTNFRLFQNLCAAARAITPPATETYRSIGQVGVLLLLASGLVAREASSRLDRPDGFHPGGLVETDRQGQPVRRWDTEGLGTIRALVMIPPHAARQGFTPGNVLALHDIAQQSLNRAAVTEFTPDGKRVRSFTGGNDVRTRLIGPLSAAFAGDGRLLVTSGWLTDGILAFADGGRQVSRFADGHFKSIAVTTNHEVVACLFTGVYSALIVLDGEGIVRRTIEPLSARDGTELPPGYPNHPSFLWMNATVDAQGRLIILRHDHNGDRPDSLVRMELMDAQGAFLGMFRLPKGTDTLIAASPNGLFAASSAEHHSVAVLRADGAPIFTLDRPMGVRPFCCAFLPASLLIGGRDVGSLGH